MTERALTYLAVPYSHPNSEVRADRFRLANIAAGRLMSLGHIVFSPISHTHPIAEACGLPLGWDYWQTFDRAYLSASRQMVILCIDGWNYSAGIKGEVAICAEMDIPVAFMLDPYDSDGSLLWHEVPA